MPVKKTCYFWLNGRACTRGASCRFLHSGTNATPPWGSSGHVMPSIRDVPVDPAKLMLDTGELLESINVLAVTESEMDGTGRLLTDYEFLSSFNWAERPAPTIFVPGSPPQWAPKDVPFQIPKDNGTYFIDQNTARCPEYPADALFHSLAAMRPDFSMRDVDLVTDRNCLRKLFSFISNTVDRSFRIDISIVNGVMIFRRWEAETKHTILPSQHLGFGHNFEAASTVPEPNLRDSVGHHRVVRYRLAGLNVVLRFEADSHCHDPAAITADTESGVEEQTVPERDPIAEKSTPEEKSTFDGKAIANGKPAAEVKSAPEGKHAIGKPAAEEKPASKGKLAAEENAALEGKPAPKQSPPPSGNSTPSTDLLTDADTLLSQLENLTLSPTTISLIPEGHIVPPSSIVELKTRSMKKLFQLSEVTAQVYFSQTPHLYIGRHSQGIFACVEKHDMTREFARWEEDHQERIKRLVALVRMLRGIAEKAPGGAVVAVCEVGEEVRNMKVYRPVKQKHSMSEEVKRLGMWSF